jgi:hypothetical protein
MIPVKGQVRMLLADALFCAPCKVSVLEERARRISLHVNLLARAAISLGVEVFERDGETYWRLPSNVVPFLRNGELAA